MKMAKINLSLNLFMRKREKMLSIAKQSGIDERGGERLNSGRLDVFRCVLQRK